MDESVLIPSPWVAGDFIEWITPPWPDVTSLTHNLQWAIRGAQILDLAAVSQPDGGWKTTVTGTQSNLSLGRYQWSALITEIASSNRTTFAFGPLEILANPLAIATPTDNRSPAAKMLDAINPPLLLA